jgi:uracil-DNA glycosylase family 4
VRRIVVSILPTSSSERQRALIALHQEISVCRRCVEAGFIPVAHPIFRGGIEHRWMILGQAPGASAETRNLPYSGATGKTLRAWLAQAGIDEAAFYEQFYLTSVTKCFPGPSLSGKGDRAPSRAEIALCGTHLDREIALVRPELVITLGKLAASVLLSSAPLAELVGTLREAERAGQRFQVLPLPHPSGVSRWLNEPENRERHARALALLQELARKS